MLNVPRNWQAATRYVVMNTFRDIDHDNRPSFIGTASSEEGAIKLVNQDIKKFNHYFNQEDYDIYIFYRRADNFGINK